ncbi:hypothetical protein [Dethiothermospora halolimnae]|uniref:hypothetical protein n=1 Tax=Dethiothermospora halolimnae TaxID=3114390 RepID=UPI003CCC3D58
MKSQYLFYVENDLYKIKIYNREEGYNRCLYRIATSDERELNESSPRKIFSRIIYGFSLYKDILRENEFNNLITDLEEMSQKLKIPKSYAKDYILGLKTNKKRGDLNEYKDCYTGGYKRNKKIIR